MTTVSTHVLDVGFGVPAVGLTATLLEGGSVRESIRTDGDGRVRFAADLAAGSHELLLATAGWFAEAGRDTFFAEVRVAFTVRPAEPHCHVAVLLSAYSYTTYKGS